MKKRPQRPAPAPVPSVAERRRKIEAFRMAKPRRRAHRRADLEIYMFAGSAGALSLGEATRQWTSRPDFDFFPGSWDNSEDRQDRRWHIALGRSIDPMTKPPSAGGPPPRGRRARQRRRQAVLAQVARVHGFFLVKAGDIHN